MNVVNRLRRSSSKWKQSFIVATLIHNFVRIEEKKVFDGKLHIDKDGYAPMDDDSTMLKCVKCSKKVKIGA